MLTDLLNAFLDFFYSPLCPNCNNICLEKNSLCKDCRCETSFVRVYGEKQLLYLDAVIVLAHYRSGFQNVLHKVKFLEKNNLLRVLQKEMILLWQSSGHEVLQDLLLKNDVYNEKIAVVPVPTDKSRLLVRGYDLPKELFYRWCLQNDFIWHECVSRVRETVPQYTLKGKQRKENMLGVMSLDYLPKEKVIIIVDDVLTTGATMVECARVIKQNDGNDKFVVGVSLASDIAK